MIKNTGSQKIGGQLITAADGSNFTGAVTVYVTGDAGSQALGSVGSGVCTHEGKGYHTYAPAQAETNYDLIAFTFIGSGAISSTVQVFTISYNPHDTVRLGLTALPNATADGAGGLPISDAGNLDLDTKLANTNEITAARMGALTDWINGGRLDLLLDAIPTVTPDAAGVAPTVAEIQAEMEEDGASILDTLRDDLADGGRLDLLIDAIKAVTDVIPNSGALTTIGTDTARLTAVRAAILTDWINGGRLDTLLDAIKAVSDSLTAAAATKLALSAGTMVTGTVSHDNTAASTTVFYSDDFTEATADHYNGRIVLFTSGVLIGQATSISDYALVSSEGKFTVVALTEAPADNVTFIIV